MTHQYRCLRLWLASLFLLVGMHTSGFSMNDSERTFTEQRFQSILRGLQEQDPSIIGGVFSESGDQVFILRRVEQRHESQPLGVFLTTSIAPAVFAYASNSATHFLLFSVVSDVLSSLANENDSLIQKALGNKESWSWKSHDFMLKSATACSLSYALTGNELARNINIAIMTTHAVVKTGLYAYDWWNTENYED